ncbi:MAG: PorP/SprF family type IX secretion system membrane protein [Flavobacteriales bacterium]|nr:PorP/SprF family type IX secretion system membrane protein [Flavobacteriales bacterium]MCB9203842.1 PorP/SprF family type IX secretion system membrane protein [Flavobacteriales bacterium]
MRKIYATLFIVGLLMYGLDGFAQQTRLSSLYKENRFLINPSNAGYSEGLVGYINYRNQWTNVVGAPTTGLVSLHTPLGKNTNVGTNIVYDKTNFVTTVNAKLAYAHDIKLAPDHQLSLGVGLGINHTQLDFSDAVVEDPTDFLLENGNIGSTTFDLDAGLRYSWNNLLEIGIAAPHVIESIAEIRAKDNSASYNLSRHFSAYVGYDFWIKKDWLIAPSGMVRWLPYNDNISYDGTVKFGWKEVVWASFTWRAETGPVAGIGFQVADKFVFGYAYDFTLNGLDGNPGAPWSNEIMVGFKLDGFKKKFKKLEDDMERMQQDNELLNEKMDSLESVLGSKMDSLESEVQGIKETDIRQDAELQRLQKEIDDINKEIEDVNSRMIDTNKLKGMLQQITPYRTDDGSVGMRKEALESGYYVVIESFRKLENAWKAVDIWKSKKRDAIIVYNEERKWFYVYSTKFDELKPALKEMRKTRKKDVPDAWVHKYRIDAQDLKN